MERDLIYILTKFSEYEDVAAVADAANDVALVTELLHSHLHHYYNRDGNTLYGVDSSLYDADSSNRGDNNDGDNACNEGDNNCACNSPCASPCRDDTSARMQNMCITAVLLK